MTAPDAVQGAYKYAAGWLGQGELPNFIPELTLVNPDRLAISITDTTGIHFSAGCTEERFTIQSVSKAIGLALAIEDVGSSIVFSRVGLEPCGDQFNSIYRLELMDKKPSNPFLNAGAIAVCGCIAGKDLKEKYERFRSLAAKLLDSPELDYSRQVSCCELETGHRNRALVNMLLDNNILSGNPDSTLKLYYRACSLLVNTREISHFGAVLALDGISPKTGQQYLPPSTCHIIRALMAGCGLYDRSGAYLAATGIPSKSGSSGVILGTSRSKAGIGVFSPRLDGKGNSVCGMKAMEYLAEKFDLRVL